MQTTATVFAFVVLLVAPFAGFFDFAIAAVLAVVERQASERATACRLGSLD